MPGEMIIRPGKVIVFLEFSQWQKRCIVGFFSEEDGFEGLLACWSNSGIGQNCHWHTLMNFPMECHRWKLGSYVFSAILLAGFQIGKALPIVVSVPGSGSGLMSRLPTCPDVSSCDLTRLGAARSREGGRSYLHVSDFGCQPLPFSCDHDIWTYGSSCWLSLFQNFQ